MTDSHTTVLLGAGASADAGVPVTMALTPRIVDRIENVYRGGETAHALNVIVGLMVAHNSQLGYGAYGGVEVEKLFSAVQMLAMRDYREAAPFVSAWHPSLEGLGPRAILPPWWATNFVRAMHTDVPYRDEVVAKQFTQGVRLLANGDPEAIFQRLIDQMIEALREELQVDAANVDYLAPLLNIPDHPIQIATLNYDASIELLAERAGLTIDRGIENWRGGYTWRWKKDSDIRLLKLHGSLDWRLGMAKKRTGFGMPQQVVKIDPIADSRWKKDSQLAVIFGEQGKLRSEGPFVAMLGAFDGFLQNSQRLIIVGYSFRDDHINAAIRRWTALPGKRQLVLIDPRAPMMIHRFMDPGLSEFRDELGDMIFDYDLTQQEDSFLVSTKRRAPDIHELVTGGARTGLQQVLGDGPTLAKVKKSK